MDVVFGQLGLTFPCTPVSNIMGEDISPFIFSFFLHLKSNECRGDDRTSTTYKKQK